jgi:uncharacterized RDD family membrane protein YckC
MDKNLRGHYAGFVSRFFAYAIDILVVSLSVIIIIWVVNTTISIFQVEPIIDIEAVSLAVTGLLLLLYVSGYYVLFWTLAGQTPGKLLLGLRIVTIDGGQISFSQALRRFAGYLLSAIFLWLGFFWILIDNRRQGWHDKVAGTVVIYNWDARLGDFVAGKVQSRQESQEASGSSS